MILMISNLITSRARETAITNIVKII